MRQSFTFNDKVNILTLLYSGMSKNRLSRIMQIDRRDITMWELRFQNFGIQGLKRLRRCTIPMEYKQEVVDACVSGEGSLRQIAADYNVSYSSLKNWLRQSRHNSQQVVETEDNNN